MLSRIVFLTSIFLLFQSILYGQNSRLKVYKDGSAYDVYSAVLSLPNGLPRSRSKNFVIRLETKPEGMPLCFEPTKEQEKIIGLVISDYKKVNQTKWRLKGKFKLDIPYQLVGSDVINSLIKRDQVVGNNFINGWGEFYQKYPGSGGAIELSAVGFNPEKTIAIVYLGLWYGNVAGSGGYYGMQKKDGKWVPLPWRVAYCDWIA